MGVEVIQEIVSIVIALVIYDVVKWVFEMSLETWATRQDPNR